MSDDRPFDLALPLVASRRDNDSSRADSSAPSTTDEQLLRRCGRGDDDAFDELLDRHRTRLREFIRYCLGAHHALLDDVMQEVLLQLHRSAETFQHGSTFRTWLYGLAKNVARHEMRRRKKDLVAESVDQEPFLEIRDVRLDPLDTLQQSEREAAVRSAVERLPAHYRTVLRLRDWDELSYAQIAEVLDLPIGTVRSRLHNARVLLANLLEHLNPEAES